MSYLEKERIDAALQSALKDLPQRLVKEMATIPPANEQIAQLYQTTVPQLEGDRKTAINMITLHAIMEKLIETRNKYWGRSERELMSQEIDNYAREVLLQKITTNSATGKSTPPRGGNAINRCVVGVSQKEKNLLNKITGYLMDECIKTMPGASEDVDLELRPIGEFKKAELSFRRVFGDVFSNLFKELNDRVVEYDKNGLLIGVDQGKIGDINQCLLKTTNGSPELNGWLKNLQHKMQAALTQAVNELPMETQNAWKFGYAKQFVNKNYDLENFADSGAALWGLREIRKEQAKKTVAIPLPESQEKEWMAQSMNGLKAIIEEYDGGLMPESPALSGKNHNFPDTGEEKTEDGFDGHSEEKYKSKAKWKGSFSDLRMAYEDNRSGVPWKDTRAQESIEKVAKPMLKKLAPEHRTGVLQALSAYGKNATRFLVKRDAEIVSQTKTIYRNEKSPKPTAHKVMDEIMAEAVSVAGAPPRRVLFGYCPLFLQNHTVFHRKNNKVSFASSAPPSLSKMFLTGNFVSGSVKMSQGSVSRAEDIALHEIGHLIDFTARLGLE